MDIRQATKNDIPEILRLLLEVHDVHAQGRPDLFKPGARKYEVDELEAVLRDPAMFVFVADAGDGSLLGHAICADEPHANKHGWQNINTFHIDDICVDETARGQGIGKALYQYVTNYARSCGYYNVTLNVWDCNPSARAFYEAMGMKPLKLGMENIL